MTGPLLAKVGCMTLHLNLKDQNAELGYWVGGEGVRIPRRGEKRLRRSYSLKCVEQEFSEVRV